ncbi:hypothetical protein Leryth_017183 [Lithospermum erythrorhizon]|nr:hypothetical protein Leryth_017183 [Lithospermum erythrorhizon]
MLLEAYFMQIDGTLNKLTTLRELLLAQLREYIDNTEDYINIQLDNHRNQLIQLELFLSAGTVCMAIYSLIAGIFGMNIPYTWNDQSYTFKWVVIVSGAICSVIFILIISPPQIIQEQIAAYICTTIVVGTCHGLPFVAHIMEENGPGQDVAPVSNGALVPLCLDRKG